MPFGSLQTIVGLLLLEVCFTYHFSALNSGLSLATDGIGLEYANNLAKMGYSLLIISRSEEKLQKVKNELMNKNPKCGDIKTLAVDFTRDDIYDKIGQQLNELEVVDVLVNNVGMSFKIGEYFTKITDLKAFIHSIINCNIVSMTRMIHLILPKMVDRKRGIIINISSFSATTPVPLLSIYSATKCFCDHLSRALYFEFKDKGVVIQSVLPSFVATNMSRLRPTFAIPSAKDYVREAISTVGIESRTYGCFSHKIIGFVKDSVSTLFGPHFVSNYIYNQLKGYRLRYYIRNNLKDD